MTVVEEGVAMMHLLTCGGVVCRAAQLADDVRKIDLLQLELPLHVDSGQAQINDKLIY